MYIYSSMSITIGSVRRREGNLVLVILENFKQETLVI